MAVRSLELDRWHVAEGLGKAVVDQPLRSLLIPLAEGLLQSIKG
jgi:hypothetical protein